MTIQVCNFNKNKGELQAALNTEPASVQLYDPSIFPSSRGDFTGEDIKPGESFPVVMDHPKRMRFASVVRKADGKFRVS